MKRKMKKVFGLRGLALALGIGALASMLILTSASVAFADDPLGAQIGQVRAANVRFHDIQTALAAGYDQILGCIEQPGEGAMRIHYFKSALVGDTTLDPLRPDMLLYKPNVNGKMELVAVEYFVFAQAWHANHSQPPSLFGQTFQVVDSPNDPLGQPPYYELLLWAWKNNPNGMFNDWNPKVICPQ